MSHLVAIFDTDKALEDALNKLSQEGLLPEEYAVYSKDQDITEGTIASTSAGGSDGLYPSFPHRPRRGPGDARLRGLGA